MLSKLTTIFEKAEFLKAIPWKGAMIVLAVAFTLATVSSIVVGKLMIPQVSISKKLGRLEKARIPMKASLNRSAVKAIVRRNIFNAEGKTGEDSSSDEAGSKPRIGDDAIETNLSLKLHGIIYGGDPESGIALVEDTSKRSTNSFMFGDQISKDAVITKILEDRIIFVRNGIKEYLKLVKKEFVRTRRKKSEKKKKRKKLSPIAVDPPPDAFKEEGFERDKNKIVMSQDFKKRMLTSNFARVLQDAKAEPNIVEGELAGFKLTRIRQDSIYEKSGLQNEDIVTEINGMELSDTGQAIKMLNGLKTETEIEIRVNRGGSFLNITIEIR